MSAQVQPSMNYLVRLGAVRARLTGVLRLEMQLEPRHFLVEFIPEGDRLPYQKYEAKITLLLDEGQSFDLNLFTREIKEIAAQVQGLVVSFSVIFEA